jgi:hypothetical protein
MKKIALILLIFAPCTLYGQLPSGFEPIFNGKDLSGWHVSRTSHQGTTPDFFAENGYIAVKQNPYGQGGILLTDKKYSNFELYIEVQIDSFCNGGIFLRSAESGQAYQVELALPGGTGSIFGEAMQISQAATADKITSVWKPGAWNSFHIRMTGEIPTVSLWVNDVKMWEVTQPKNDFTAEATSGFIGLQSHWTATYQTTEGGFNMPGAWRPGAMHRFRNIGIRELKK